METPVLELDLEARKTIASSLSKEARQVILRFPKVFDNRLSRGLERLFANSSSDFLFSRSHFHLKRILLAQFSLQKQMEDALLSKSQPPLFLKLFRTPPSRICIAFTALASRGIQKEQVLKELQGLLPTVKEVSGSFFVWHHPSLPYLFSYFEVQKLRGEDPSSTELREFERRLLSQLLATSPLTPALFWPYNKEDSFRQIQLLQREVNSRNDLPHVSIYFQEQTLTSLEFLIHLARPAGPVPLEESLKKLPNTFSFFSQFYRSNKTPFPIEIGAFSIKIPSFTFEVRESINLLYARRYILKHLEAAIGPFRDTNGGLFEIQQQHFEALRSHLSEKIPQFELFAEKIFYALHPVETWLTLSLSDAEAFFSAFSSLFADPTAVGSRIKKGSFAILKTSSDHLSRSFSEFKEKLSHAQISFGDSHFVCLIGPDSELADVFWSEELSTKKLSLYFQEGPPPSLNPHYSSGDMRCKILNKLLFEGITRLNQKGDIELAGAENYTLSQDGLLYTFKLRPSFWSNGEKVTAADYVSSWKKALTDSVTHPENLFILKGARTFKKTGKGLNIQATDAATLEIALEKPDPSFLHKLAQPFFFPLFGSMREPKWFNGPYLVRNLSKESLLLDKNAYYWNANLSSMEQIEFQWDAQGEPIDRLFEKGKLDWIGDPLTTLSAQQALQLQEEEKLSLKTVRRRFLLYFNTRYPILASSLIRRALSLSLDRTFLCEAIFPKSIPLCPLFPMKQEAQNLFESGLKELGLTLATFPPLTFRFSRQTRREELAAYLQSAWQEAFGITVRIQGEEWNDFRNRLEEKTFEICGTIQDTIAEGTVEYYERFEGSNSWNFSQWKHPRYRQLLEEGKKDFTPSLRKELDQILEEEAPISPLFNYTHLYAHNPRLEGFWIDVEGCVDFSRALFRR